MKNKIYPLAEAHEHIDSSNKFIRDNLQLYLGHCEPILDRLPENSVDACIGDPPYGFSNKTTDAKDFVRCLADNVPYIPKATAGIQGQAWDNFVPQVGTWKSIYRVLKPGGWVISFGGGRTYHHMAMCLELAGFEVWEMLGWLYGNSPSCGLHVDSTLKSGKTSDEQMALLQPWKGYASRLRRGMEPILLARKPLARKGFLTSIIQNQVGLLNTGEVRELTGNFPMTVLFEDSRAIAASLGEKSKSFIPCSWHPDDFESFYYCKKPSQTEKDEGCESLESKVVPAFFSSHGPVIKKNDHCTVKPVSLMRWLCKLVKTPYPTIVLDPFLGSGTTGIAAMKEGMQFIGIEAMPNYFEIAKSRIDYTMTHKHSFHGTNVKKKAA